VLRKDSVQVAPPSSVLKTREASPSPMARTTARRASNASMSRNSRSAAPGGETFRQLAPPSVVRRTVPSAPATQAVSRLTADSPRKRTSLPLSLSAQWAVFPASCACAGAAVSAAANAAAHSPTVTARLVRLDFPKPLMAGEASPLPGRRPDALGGNPAAPVGVLSGIAGMSEREMDHYVSPR
jgi:hypothetical protein